MLAGGPAPWGYTAREPWAVLLRGRASLAQGQPTTARLRLGNALDEGISYGASKAALESCSRSAALEFARHGITVNVVSPGPIQTGWIPKDLEAAIAAECPLGRLGTPEDIADVVVFLAAEQARWITGPVLHVGGGHTL